MTGLTAEAAVERVQSDTRARMLRQTDPYLRERLHDLDDLANRLMRQLTGRDHAPSRESLPENAILVARSMGPAALLDYDRKRLRGLILEEGGPHSHVAIVARALGIPAIGEIDNAIGIVDPGDAVIVDGSTGDLHIRPLPDMEAAYAERVRLRARRQQQYSALRDKPCVTKDGEEIKLLINAGLSVDLPHIDDTGAAGIGLFRTELQFMVAPNFPRTSEQYTLYRAVLDAAGDKPVTFRTLDIGGDKVLPYMRNVEEENPGARLARHPARARPARPVAHANSRAVAGGRQPRAEDHVPDDLDGAGIRSGQGTGRTRIDASAAPRPQAARRGRGRQHGRGAVAALSARRIARARRFPLGRLERSGAVSLRDRSRQSAGVEPLRRHCRRRCLRALKDIADKAHVHQKPATVCGELASHPIGALALVAIGYRSLSLTPSAVGPVKAMLLDLDCRKAAAFLCPLIEKPSRGPPIREQLEKFATESGLQL